MAGQRRFYRGFHSSWDLIHFNVRVKETDIDIGAQRILKDESIILVNECRREIEAYIRKAPEFLTSLTPLPYKTDAPPIIKNMLSSAIKCKVGPMASIAGAISQYVGQGLSSFSREIIVENGGDIYLKSTRERIIGIYAGDSPLSGQIGLRIGPMDQPLGICTSSGRVGHSLSFGRADAVVVLSRDTALADAAATATGNIVKTPDDIEDAIGFVKGIEGITGVIIIIEDKIGAWGNIQLTRL